MKEINSTVIHIKVKNLLEYTYHEFTFRISSDLYIEQAKCYAQELARNELKLSSGDCELLSLKVLNK